MSYTLSKTDANKIVKVDQGGVVTLPSNVFSKGDALIIFNNTDEFISIHSLVENSYRSSRAKKRSFIEFPPRALANAIFIDDDIVVISVGF
jgi:hypothetical protein